MHTKNINRRLQKKRMKHVQRQCSCFYPKLQQTSPPQNGERMPPQTQNQPLFSAFSSDTYCSLRRTVSAQSKTGGMTPDPQRGSFQRKFRSLWFGTSSKKKENKDRLQESSRVKSVSSPSLVPAQVEKRTNLIPSTTSAFDLDALPTEACPDDCQCNQICPCCMEDQERQEDSSQHITDATHANDLALSGTSHTLPRNFTVCIPASECNSPPLRSCIEDQYVFVISDSETTNPQLTVRTEKLTAEDSAPCSPHDQKSDMRGRETTHRNTDADRSLASTIPDRMGSAESHDYLYKSSSASESGRGTLPSETERLNIQPCPKTEPEYSAVSRTRKISARDSENHRSKYPQLYVASNRAPMPPVIESESWVSDGSTFQEVVGPHDQSLAKSKKNELANSSVKATNAKGRSSRTPVTAGTRIEKSHRLHKWKSTESISSSGMDRDDMTSEFTADVSVSNDRNIGLKQDLKTLQVMYDKIFKRLSVGNQAGVRQHKRRAMGSISTINSISRACESRRITSARKQPLTESSKKIRRIEENVVSLSRSVGNLTIEVRETEKLRDQIVSLKKEFSSIQKQMSNLQIRIDSQNSKGKSESSEKLYSSVKKQGKISRLFSEEPTPIRLFLKKLGYERYSCLFDEERIGMEELMVMSEDKLQKLGIPMGPRTRIFQEIHKHRTIARTRHH